VRWIAALGPGSTKAPHDPLIVPGKRQAGVIEELLRRQIARLPPIEDRLGDIWREVGQADEAREVGPAAPPGLDDPARIPMGTEHFAAHCAVCHGAPGVPKGDIANGLYPQPPDLAVTGKSYSDGELFWILKHGIKMTGMPAWADHSDDELWATVAFVRKLPGMTQEEYGKLVMQSMQGGGHHMQGGETMPENTHPMKHDGMDHGGAQPPLAGPAKPENGHGHQP
jgi:mono/diheme cytochrome c family protein